VCPAASVEGLGSALVRLATRDPVAGPLDSAAAGPVALAWGVLGLDPESDRE
jgi:hypothetical protein